VNSAKKDLSKLRNVDRPLYDLLLTKEARFRGGTHRSKVEMSEALPVGGDYLIGDIPRLAHNLEESSFLTADQSRL